jgi:hypothetical protein
MTATRIEDLTARRGTLSVVKGSGIALFRVYLCQCEIVGWWNGIEVVKNRAHCVHLLPHLRVTGNRLVAVW